MTEATKIITKAKSTMECRDDDYYVCTCGAHEPQFNLIKIIDAIRANIGVTKSDSDYTKSSNRSSGYTKMSR